VSFLRALHEDVLYKSTFTLLYLYPFSVFVLTLMVGTVADRRGSRRVKNRCQLFAEMFCFETCGGRVKETNSATGFPLKMVVKTAHVCTGPLVRGTAENIRLKGALYMRL